MNAALTARFGIEIACYCSCPACTLYDEANCLELGVCWVRCVLPWRGHAVVHGMVVPAIVSEDGSVTGPVLLTVVLGFVLLRWFTSKAEVSYRALTWLLDTKMCCVNCSLICCGSKRERERERRVSHRQIL